MLLNNIINSPSVSMHRNTLDHQKLLNFGVLIQSPQEKYFSKWMFCTSILFGIYLLQVVIGKAALVWNLEVLSSILIGDVAEFLLLLLAIVFFTVEILRLERLRQPDNSQINH